MRLVFGFILAFALLATAAQAEDFGPWSAARNGNVCEASATGSDGATITIAAMGPQYLLLFQHASFPTDKQTAVISVRLDGGPPMELNALGSDRVYGLAITPQLGIPLRHAAALEMSLGGKSWTFDVHQAGEAMDAVAACAGIPTLPDTWRDAPAPIAGAPGWVLVEHVPGSNRCSARRNSPEVNTSLIYSEKGDLILIAGRPEWAKWGSEIKLSIQVDDAPPVGTTGGLFQNIVLVALKDQPALEASLRKGKTITWQLPWGTFHGDIAGLDLAAEALRQCDARNAKH